MEPDQEKVVARPGEGFSRKFPKGRGQNRKNEV